MDLPTYHAPFSRVSTEHARLSVHRETRQAIDSPILTSFTHILPCLSNPTDLAISAATPGSQRTESFTDLDRDILLGRHLLCESTENS